MQMQLCIQLQTRTCLTYFVNCMYAMNANKVAIFEFLVTVSTGAKHLFSYVSAVTYFQYW